MWQCAYTNRYGFRVTTEHHYPASAAFEAQLATDRGYVPVVRRTDHLAEITRMDRPEVRHKRRAA